MIIIINEANKMMYKREGEGERVNESGACLYGWLGCACLEGPREGDGEYLGVRRELHRGRSGAAWDDALAYTHSSNQGRLRRTGSRSTVHKREGLRERQHREEG